MKSKRVLQCIAQDAFQFPGQLKEAIVPPPNPLCPWNIDYFPGSLGGVLSKTVVAVVTQINDLSTLV